MQKKHLIWFLTAMLSFTGCGLKKEAVFKGKTMGTTYQVKVVAGYFADTDALGPAIDKTLDAVNQSMSIYRKDSEISKFNRLETRAPFPVSPDFARVMNASKQLYRESGGAWDATVEPLVELWGFGTRIPNRKMPDPDAVRKAQTAVGFNLVDITGAPALVKKDPAVTLNLNSIAKGYGVDRVAEMIASKGFSDYLVEIGGEVAASGKRKDGKKWRIGINTPIPGSPFNQVYKVVTLQDRAMATSGDYRNFFVIDGVLYSHVIDPRTAYPVANGVVSVSIIAETCMRADGLATAVMVMGLDDGMALVRNQPGVEAMIVLRDKEGALRNHYSPGFETVLSDP